MKLLTVAVFLLYGCQDDLTSACTALQDVTEQQRILSAETAADAVRHQADLIELRTLPPSVRDDAINTANDAYQLAHSLAVQQGQNLGAAAGEHRERAYRLNPSQDPCAGK